MCEFLISCPISFCQSLTFYIPQIIKTIKSLDKIININTTYIFTKNLKLKKLNSHEIAQKILQLTKIPNHTTGTPYIQSSLSATHTLVTKYHHTSLVNHSRLTATFRWVYGLREKLLQSIIGGKRP